MKRFLTYLPLILALVAPFMLKAEGNQVRPMVQLGGAEYVDSTIYDYICEGAPTYTNYGFNLRTDTLVARSSAYMFYRMSANNDTIYYLQLTVHPSYHTYDTLTICQNMLPMRYGTRDFPTSTVSGDYGVSFHLQSECDSLVSLHLTVETMMLRDTIAVACHSFTWDRTQHTYNYSPPGISQPDSYMLMGRNGTCDTLLRLGLLLYDTVRYHYDTVVCDNYTFGGNTYATNHTHVVRGGTSSVHGCDSVVYYHFNVLHSVQIDFYVEVFDDVYVWPYGVGDTGAIFYISGIANRVSTGANGCDSITTLHLELHGMPVWCTNEEFENNQYHGFTIPTPHVPGTHVSPQRQLRASDGVSDSIAMLRYRFVQAYTGTLDSAIVCTNDTLLFHGNVVAPHNEGGRLVHFVDTTVLFRTIEGCDSGYAVLRVYPTEVRTDTMLYRCRRPADYLRGDSAGFYAERYYNVAAMCDSVIYPVMHLVPDTVIYHREACVNYTWEATDGTTTFSKTYSNTGSTPNYYIPDNHNTDTVKLHNIGGCDSTVVLSLILKPQSVVDTVINACYSLAWPRLDTVFGVGRHSTITDTLARANSYRCDSILRMDIRVYDTVRRSFDSNVCESYSYGGHTYTESGEHRVVLGTSLRGCDSVGYVNFILFHNKQVDLYYKVYDSIFHWSEGTDSTYRLSTVDSLVYGITGDCDSTITMHLQLLGTIPELCSNELPDSMYLNFKVVDYSAGLHRHAVSDTIAGPDGVDTVEWLSYLMKRAYVFDSVRGICADDTLFFQGRTYHDPDNLGVHHDTVAYTAANGCDSLFALRLTIATTFDTTLRSTICRGSYLIFAERFEDYSLWGNIFVEHGNGTLPTGWRSLGGDWHTAATSGDSYGNYVPFDGDSAAYMNGTGSGARNFLVSPPIDLRYSDTVDISFWYINPEVGGNTNSVCLFWTETPDVASSWRSLWCARGSVTNWSRTELHLRSSQYKKIIYLGFESNDMGGCSGFDSIKVCGYNNAPNDTTYITIDTLYSKGGCDSVVTRIVKVIGPSQSTVYDTACDYYTWTIASPNGTAIYNRNYVNNTTSHLHLSPANANTDTAHLINYGGCDSLVLLDLLLKGKTLGPTDSITRCNPYEWRVQQLDGKWETAGTFFDHDTVATYAIRNSEGCDSVLSLVYHYAPYLDSVRRVKACDSYTFRGITYITSSTAYDTIPRTTTDGCDIVVSVRMQIDYTTYADDSNMVCERLKWIDGRTYTASTNSVYYTDTNVAGCDSIVRLVLTVEHSPVLVVDTQVCDRFVYEGVTYDSTANYELHVPIGQVCDSIVNIRLAVYKSTANTVDYLSCGTYNWNGFLCDTSGLYTQLFADRHGCDSLIWLNLTIASEYVDSTVRYACGSLRWIDNNTYTASGRYTHRVPAQSDSLCDSLFILMLNVDSLYSIRVDSVACDSLVWNDSVYTSTTNHIVHYLSSHGCDSIVTLAAVVNHSANTHNDVKSCNQYMWNGELYSQSGTYSQQLQSLLTGCDSTSEITLTLYPTERSQYDTFACDSYLWGGQTYGRTGHFTRYFSTIYGCDSVVELNLTIGHTSNTSFYDTAWRGFYVWNNITYTTTGDYQQSFTGWGGCDSVVTLHLTVYNSIVNAGANGLLTLYPNPTRGEVTIEGSEVMSVDVLDLVGRRVAHHTNTNHINLGNLPAGLYVLKVTVPDGQLLMRVVKE